MNQLIQLSPYRYHINLYGYRTYFDRFEKQSKYKLFCPGLLIPMCYIFDIPVNVPDLQRSKYRNWFAKQRGIKIIQVGRTKIYTNWTHEAIVEFLSRLFEGLEFIDRRYYVEV